MIPLHSDTAGRVRVRTSTGVPVGRRPATPREVNLLAIRRRLMGGAFLASFDAVDRVRDIAGQLDRAHLVNVLDDELLDAIDRDAELRRRVA